MHMRCEFAVRYLTWPFKLLRLTTESQRTGVRDEFFEDLCGAVAVLRLHFQARVSAREFIGLLPSIGRWRASSSRGEGGVAPPNLPGHSPNCRLHRARMQVQGAGHITGCKAAGCKRLGCAPQASALRVCMLHGSQGCRLQGCKVAGLQGLQRGCKLKV